MTHPSLHNHIFVYKWLHYTRLTSFYFVIFLLEIVRSTNFSAPCAHKSAPTNSQVFAFGEALPHFSTRSFEQNVYAHEGKTFLSRAQTFILVSANLFYREKKVDCRYCNARKVHRPRFESESAAIKGELAASLQAPAATAAADCEARSLRRQTPRHTLYIIYRPAAMINDHRAERKLTTGKNRRSGRLHG